ncbi:MAG: hypothetical protein WC841_05385 [Candidatus Shapirobacteria bacterium]|jgi:hypothetical protein
MTLKEGDPQNQADILLITRDEFDNSPDGTVFISIFGQPVVKGADSVNLEDTRAGLLPLGLPVANQAEAQNSQPKGPGVWPVKG